MRAILRRVIAECRSPSRLLELYYWSIEPELAEVMRWYITLPADARTALHGFLALVEDDPSSVNVHISPEGAMTFSSPAAKELERKIADGGPPPALPH